jgi:hypothetical protein
LGAVLNEFVPKNEPCKEAGIPEIVKLPVEFSMKQIVFIYPPDAPAAIVKLFTFDVSVMMLVLTEHAAVRAGVEDEVIVSSHVAVPPPEEGKRVVPVGNEEGPVASAA